MPTYEYRCPEGHESEDFVLRISAAKSEIPCPVCGATAARRVSAGAGLVFKGSGFYITDYGKDGKKDQQKPAAATTNASGDSAGAPAAASAPAASSAAPSNAASSNASTSSSSAPAAPSKSESSKSESSKSDSSKSSAKKSGPSSGSNSSGSQ